MTTRKEMWVTHPPCAQTWIVAYLPMELGKVAGVMRAARCPKCGAKKGIKMAREADIVAAQPPVIASTPKPEGLSDAPWPAF